MNAHSDRDYTDSKVGDVRAAVDELRCSNNARFDGVHASINDLRVSVHERSDALREEMNARLDALEARMAAALEKAVGSMIRWVVGLFLTTIALCVALSSVVMNLVLRQPSPAPPTVAAPALLIQLTPQGATVTPAAPPGKP
jgi:hypothetical protein